MRKLIAAINMTLDGFCDHTAITTADDELHEHYNELLKSAGTVIYGRVTYQLMEFWATLVKNPSGNKSMDDFAITMNNVPKLVFSHTLKTTELNNTRVAKGNIKEEILALRQEPGKDIFVGSPGLILATMDLDLIDEYQLCVHPVIAGSGLPLFKNINNRIELKLLKTKTFGSGAVILYYEPIKK